MVRRARTNPTITNRSRIIDFHSTTSDDDKHPPYKLGLLIITCMSMVDRLGELPIREIL